MLSSGSLINCGPGQKHVAQEVIGSREKPATLSSQGDILSNGPLSAYVYTHRLVLLSTLGSSECRGTHTLAKAPGTFQKSGWDGCKNWNVAKKWCAALLSHYLLRPRHSKTHCHCGFYKGQTNKTG